MDKKMIDIEYSTQNEKEMRYLRACNIPYTYIKVNGETPIFKYKKSKELFEALAVFYRNK